MNKLLSLFLLCIFPLSVKAQDLIASCCETSEARCTGSSYCSACTNCSRCAHCSSGGSCGVCADYKAPKKSSTKKQTDSSYSKSNKLSQTRELYNKEQILYASNATLNIRKGPGTEYEIVEKIKHNDILFFLEQSGDWLKVRIKTSKKEGWVYARYVKKQKS